MEPCQAVAGTALRSDEMPKLVSVADDLKTDTFHRSTEHEVKGEASDLKMMCRQDPWLLIHMWGRLEEAT